MAWNSWDLRCCRFVFVKMQGARTPTNVGPSMADCLPGWFKQGCSWRPAQCCGNCRWWKGVWTEPDLEERHWRRLNSVLQRGSMKQAFRDPGRVRSNECLYYTIGFWCMAFALRCAAGRALGARKFEPAKTWLQQCKSSQANRWNIQEGSGFFLVSNRSVVSTI